MNCYILVGGRSRRMGRSKPGLFLERVAAAARPAFDDVIAVQRPGGPAVAIPTIHESPHEADGPIFGIECALEHARARCAIVAVDYPLVTTELFRYLLEAGRDAPMLVPVWQGRAQPLCAIYDPAVLPLIRRRIGVGRLDVSGLIDEVPAALIDETTLRAKFGGEPLLNANTPAELHEAEARYGE